MPTLGAHSGESESGVMLLGNWKSPAMARDYVAFAQAIPLNMARRAAIRHGWLPNYEGALAVTGSQQVKPVGDSMLELDADNSSVDDITPKAAAHMATLVQDVEMHDTRAPPLQAGGHAPPASAPTIPTPAGTDIMSDSEPSDTEPDLVGPDPGDLAAESSKPSTLRGSSATAIASVL